MPSDYRPQAAAIALHEGRVCLITSRRRKRWVIPKGHIDVGKTAPDIARQEAWEEAGLRGVLIDTPIGTYHYSKSSVRFRVLVFIMNVTTVALTWPECQERERRWFPPSEALVHLEEPGLRSLLENLIQADGSGVNR